MAVKLRKRATTLLRVGLVAAIAVPALGIAVLLVLAYSPLGTYRMAPVKQPVEFDHRHHAGDDAIDCRYCHSTVETSATAGYPPTATCLACHAQIWNQSPLLGLVRQAYFEDRPIPWQRVHELPWYVYFDHSIHVNKGIGCVTCHGRVDLMPAISQVEPLTMAWCLDCHRNPVPHLRPIDHVADTSWEPPPGKAGDELRARLAKQYDVHPRIACTTCHR